MEEASSSHCPSLSVAPHPPHHMYLLLLLEPLSPYLPVRAGTAPLIASVNAFCPYKERAQADCTICFTLAGVLQGQGDDVSSIARVRKEEEGHGERMEG